MSSSAATFPDLSPRSLVLCSGAGGFGLLAWLVWFAWDTRIHVDERGDQSGPYEAWQVVGCVVTLTLVLIVAQLAGADRLLSSMALCTTFTAGFSISSSLAGDPDDANLFLVGAFFVFIGTGMGAGLISALTARLGQRGPTRQGRA